MRRRFSRDGLAGAVLRVLIGGLFLLRDGLGALADAGVHGRFSGADGLQHLETVVSTLCQPCAGSDNAAREVRQTAAGASRKANACVGWKHRTGGTSGLHRAA